MKKFYSLLIMLASIVATKAQDAVNFTFTVTGNSVSFTNTSVLYGDGPRKAYWSFGDGTRLMTTALGNAQHSYNSYGSFTVCLKIYRYAGNDSTVSGDVCKTITLQSSVADSCKGSFSVMTTSTGNTKVFVANPYHNNGKKPERICWNFGDGHDTCIFYNPAQTYNYAVYHTYTQAGNYNVCVSFKYQGGCESKNCHLVEVNNPATCKIEYRTETTASLPLTKYFIPVLYNSLNRKPLRICWKFGDGRDTCISYTTLQTGPYAVRHDYATNGRYEVCVSVLYDGGCEAKYCRVDSIQQPPPPKDTCFINLHEAAVAATSIERKFYLGLTPGKVPLKICWSFGDGKDSCVVMSNPATQQQMIMPHLYPAPGNYEVCTKVFYDGGCTAVKCMRISIAAPSNTICGGYITDSLVEPKVVLFKGFGIQNTNDHVVSWQWSFGDGTTANTREVRHVYTAGGKYEVCLVIKTDLGCQTRICKTVTIQAPNTTTLVLTPNPVVNVLHAVFQSSFQQPVSIYIYNANGILIKSFARNAMVGANSWDFDLSTLPTGIYSLIVQSTYQLANAIFFKQ